MNQLSRNNLQEFCRTCLKSLQKRRRRERESSPTSLELLNANDYDKDNDSDSIYSYNLSLLPELQKLFVLFTSLEFSETDNEDVYPRSLCQLCYDKMIDFQEFRHLAINSAEVLYKIVNSLDDELTKAPDEAYHLQPNEDKEGIIEKFSIERSYQNIHDDDDQLLLPELAPLRENLIKKEPLDYYKPDNHSEMILPNDISENSTDVIIKTEIDLEYEKKENSLFNDNNALDKTYNSISDDADDEDRTYSSSRKIRDRNKKSLKCPRCDKYVYKQVYLDAHIRGVHEGHEKPFLCLECQKAYTRYDQLHTHIQSHHMYDAVFKFSNTSQMNDTTSFRSGLQFNSEIICQQCFKQYSSKRALSEHLKRHAQIKNHICTECGVGKVTSTELQIHMRTHQSNLEKFKCSICPQEFSHKNAISRHVRVVHEGQRRFPCSYCQKRFSTRNSQISHERLHTGERPFNCEVCDKRFAQVEGLKSHMKNHDKTLRKHICSFCSARFITRKNLINHERRHQGDKPHLCNACGRGFFSIEDLGAHKQSHTEDELHGELEPSDYDTYQDAGDSLGEPAMEAESCTDNRLGAFFSYIKSQSSN
ncbi:zinc finger protein 84-like isoform X1 [Rhagoletis pomonella]|uniref:zinc finger protein 84-like isoform X1 n=1 Tax=Rhagoletis pomonella TaxID=28610 RepID=UPI00177CF7D2|nr:zinc finger protein 84-like isoform X1 [Rhagoletis pomonella]